jgi:hypothetical protein
MGGTDDPTNLIELTVEEHALAHKQLFEQYGKWQDEVAWNTLSGQISQAEAIIQSIKKANTGRKHTLEQRKEKSESMLGDKNHFYGKRHKNETKEKIAESRIGKPSWNKGKKANWVTEKNISNNPAKTPEAKSKMSSAKKGRTWKKDLTTGKRIWL